MNSLLHRQTQEKKIDQYGVFGMRMTYFLRYMFNIAIFHHTYEYQLTHREKGREGEKEIEERKGEVKEHRWIHKHDRVRMQVHMKLLLEKEKIVSKWIFK